MEKRTKKKASAVAIATAAITAAAEFGMSKTTGDGGGIVTNAAWGEEGSVQTYDNVLSQIKAAMPNELSEATVFLLSYEDLGSPVPWSADDSRIVYNQDGVGDNWCLATPSGPDAFFVDPAGAVGLDGTVTDNLGIAPGFSY